MNLSRMKQAIGLPFVDLILRHRLGVDPEIDKILEVGRKPCNLSAPE